ncbi:MAG: hypothetical protein ACXAD7_20810 [Candidatus Kariarchaeaceae archaeon]
MSGTLKNSSILSSADQLPGCVRTFLRAKILLTLHHLQPTSALDLVHRGFKKSTVGKVLRETNRQGITFERYRLHRITPHGNQIIKLLLQDVLVNNWFLTNSLMSNWNNNELNKPRVIKITGNP